MELEAPKICIKCKKPCPKKFNVFKFNSDDKQLNAYHEIPSRKDPAIKRYYCQECLEWGKKYFCHTCGVRYPKYGWAPIMCKDGGYTRYCYPCAVKKGSIKKLPSAQICHDCGKECYILTRNLLDNKKSHYRQFENALTGEIKYFCGSCFLPDLNNPTCEICCKQDKEFSAINKNGGTRICKECEIHLVKDHEDNKIIQSIKESFILGEKGYKCKKCKTICLLSDEELGKSGEELVGTTAYNKAKKMCYKCSN